MSATATDQASAISVIPQDMAILKLENDTIQSLAASRPRNHQTIKADIIAQLEAYPAFAQAAIYAKPVGRDPDTGRQKIARGLSVRAAEALAEAYGYCRIRTDVSPVDADTVKVEATFTDYQKGRIWQDAGLVSKWYRSKQKKMVKHDDDRFYNVVVKAEISRRVREVIIRSVPPGLRAELQAMAEAMMAKTLSGDGIQKIVKAFGKHGVSLVQLEEFVGRTIAAGWTEEDRVDLLGVFNAIEAGETTVAEAFGKSTDEKPTNGADHKPTGPVSGSDLANAKVSQPLETLRAKLDAARGNKSALVDLTHDVVAVAGTRVKPHAGGIDLWMEFDALVAECDKPAGALV